MEEGVEMVSRRTVVIVMGLMGCSLLGVGLAELAWMFLFPPSTGYTETLLASSLMVLFGIILLILTNRLNTEE